MILIKWKQSTHTHDSLVSSSRLLRLVHFIVVTVAVTFTLHVDTAMAAASFVRASNNKATGSAGNYTLSVTLTGTPAAGNLLIASISLKYKPNVEPTMSGWDTRTSACAAGNIACTYVFTKLAAGNETSVSLPIDSTNATYSAIITVLEYSGAVNTFLSSSIQTGSDSSSILTGEVTPARSNSLIFAVITQNNGTAYTSPGTSPDPLTGWAKRADEKNTGGIYPLNIGYFDRLSGNTAGTAHSLSPTISGQGAAWSSIIFNFDSAESAIADLALTNTVSNATPLVGDTLTFTITATNNGSSDNTGVQVTDLLPSGLTYVSSNAAAGTTYNSSTGLWNIGSIANGASKILTITATVNSGQAGNTMTNTASKTAANITDPVSGNNSASRSITVLVTPAVSTYSPSDNDTDVSPSGDFVMTFNTPMAAGAGSVHLWCNGSLEESLAANGGRVSISSATVTINPTNNLPYGASCYILVDANAFVSQAGAAFAGIASSGTWSFTTAEEGGYRITNLPAGISSRTLTNENPETQDQRGNKWVRFRKTVGGVALPTADVNVAFSSHRDCSSSVFNTNVTNINSVPVTPKAVIHLDNTCGESADATHILYIAQGSSNRVRFCPHADTLDEVYSDCPDGFLLADGETQVFGLSTIHAVFNVDIGNDVMAIRLEGLRGSGGQGENNSVPEFSTWSFLLVAGICVWMVYRTDMDFLTA